MRGGDAQLAVQLLAVVLHQVNLECPIAPLPEDGRCSSDVAAGQSRGFTLPLTQSTISPIRAPGVKIWETPCSLSATMSARGMIPPPNTTMSDASLALSSCTTFGS